MSKAPIDALLDKVDYIPVDAPKDTKGLPYVTHEGILELGDASLRVVVLNTGQRIIPTEQLERFFGKDVLNLLKEMHKIEHR